MDYSRIREEARFSLKGKWGMTILVTFLAALLGGLVWGVFLHKKQTNGRILCAVLIEQLILSLLLNTLWISILYSSPFVPLMTSRVVQCLVLGPVQFITVKVMCRFLQRYQKKFS